MIVTLDYQPTPKQQAFHRAKEDEVLYGGAAGGGKSRAIVMEALMRALETPGAQCYLFRRTYPELHDTLVAEALAALPAGLGTYRAAQHEISLINGSVLRFRHCAREEDRFKYQGAEMTHLFIDELTHFSCAMYDYLRTRLRAPVRLNVRPIVRLTANPGGRGHAWVKARFVDAGLPGKTIHHTVGMEATGAKQVRTRLYLPATCRDNPHLPEDYAFELSQKPPALRAALLEGRWDAFEGQAFPEWKDEPEKYASGRWTHVILPFDIPKDWPRWRSFDFGYARPFSVGWWAVNPEGGVIRYREWYGARRPNEGLRIDPAAIAQGIFAQEERHEPGIRVRGVADPSIYDASRGESIALRMEREGIWFEPGDHARLAGKMQLHGRLRFDEEGMPGMQVFASCKDTLRTLPALAADMERPEDVDTSGEDHIYDEMRYFLMARPLPGAVKHFGKRRARSPLDD